MAPDTQQNIFYTVYFLLLHNWQPMFYFCGLLSSFAWSYMKPSRGKILLLLGFALLLFSFEYSKHIEDPLVEQTRNSLITERQNQKVERVIHLALSRAIPVGLPILGWIVIGSGTWMELTRHKKRYNDREV
ncbi:MAG: hypothetical protein WCO78_00555 [Candidatus Roizmanbacteria bacterium]